MSRAFSIQMRRGEGCAVSLEAEESLPMSCLIPRQFSERRSVDHAESASMVLSSAR